MRRICMAERKPV